MAKQAFNFNDIKKQFGPKFNGVFNLLEPLLGLVFGKDMIMRSIRIRRAVAILIDISLLVIISKFSPLSLLYNTLIYFTVLEGLIGIGSVGKMISGLTIEAEVYNVESIDGVARIRMLIRSTIKALMIGNILNSYIEYYEINWILIAILFIPYRASGIGRTLHDTVSGTLTNAKEDVLKFKVVEPNMLYASFKSKANVVVEKAKPMLNEMKPVDTEATEKVKEEDLEDLY